METVRLWKLGTFDGLNSIVPTKEAVEKLRELIEVEKSKKSGTLDIVWGPELNLEVFAIDENGSLSKC